MKNKISVKKPKQVRPTKPHAILLPKEKKPKGKDEIILDNEVLE